MEPQNRFFSLSTKTHKIKFCTRKTDFSVLFRYLQYLQYLRYLRYHFGTISVLCQLSMHEGELNTNTVRTMLGMQSLFFFTSLVHGGDWPGREFRDALSFFVFPFLLSSQSILPLGMDLFGQFPIQDLYEYYQLPLAKLPPSEVCLHLACGLTQGETEWHWQLGGGR